MECGNCGAENSDDAVYCKKCKSLLKGKFRSIVGFPYEISFFNIVVGVIVASILLGVSYLVIGGGTVLFGLIIIVAGGFVTGIMDRNVCLNSDDISAAVNGGITGFVVGILFLISANLFSTISLLIVSALIFYIILGVAGGGIGGYISYLGRNNKKWKILLSIVVIIVILIAGYLINQDYTEGEYDTAYRNQITNIGLADVIQLEADADLNMKTNTTEQRKIALSNAKIKYERMKDLADDSKMWNMEMMKCASSDLKKEYAIAVGKYVDLKYNYYNEMDTGINFAINGNEKEAQIHYQNAKILMPQIQNQKNLLMTIANKDLEFKKHIDQQDWFTSKAVERHKSKRMDYNFI